MIILFKNINNELNLTFADILKYYLSISKLVISFTEYKKKKLKFFFFFFLRQKNESLFIS